MMQFAALCTMKSASSATCSFWRNMKQIGCQLSSLCKFVGLYDLYLELTQSLHGPLSALDSGVFHGMHFGQNASGAGGTSRRNIKHWKGEKTIRSRNTVSKICLCKALGCNETVQGLDPGLEFIIVTTDLDKGRSSCHTNRSSKAIPHRLDQQ